jgi:hypothetical protein
MEEASFFSSRLRNGRSRPTIGAIWPRRFPEFWIPYMVERTNRNIAVALAVAVALALFIRALVYAVVDTVHLLADRRHKELADLRQPDPPRLATLLMSANAPRFDAVAANAIVGLH